MLSEKDFKKLCDVIYRRCGIKIDEKKFTILGRKIVNYIEENKFTNFRSFFHDIRFYKSESLFQNLINVVTINETYFYREKHQFEVLVNHTLYEIHNKKPLNEPIRILCCPSSTGEEPYSIALHLLDEGKLVEERDFEIIGTDIDTTVIKKAQAGLFSKRSVQFIPLKLRAKYFDRKDEKFQIDEFLRDVVDFKIVNVMDKLAMKKLGKFDIIFSRNMLIYFDDISRKEVAVNFYDILNKDGYLFLGHAESMSRISSLFKTIKVENSIIYKK